MLFQNQDSSLKLEVFNYELPADGGAPDSDDRNWLVLRCTWIEDGEIHKDSNSCLLTYELREMTAGLKVVKAGIRDLYVSDFQEDYYFSLGVRALENGTFEAAVSFYLPNTMDGDDTAELTCSLTIEELGALIDELDRLCAKFPERS